MDLWEKLGKPKFIVAPMVDASELAWRMLCRRHGAQLCYTPMLHSLVFTQSEKYRNESMATCEEDRPLIVQFCANNASVLLKAAQMVQDKCDGIDLNLGCPQSIAKRGHYGSYLQDEWDQLSSMVRVLRENVSIPVTCKIRIFADIDKSVAYARMLEDAGIQMLTVHGRTREQKGPLTGVASWAHIKAIREAVKIPVIANGNIQCLNDVHRCINETGCKGVMSAEGVLFNPALFEGTLVPVWEVALEYLQLTDLYPCPLSYIRGHLFKLFQHIFVLPENDDLRRGIALGRNKDDFLSTTLKIKSRFEVFHTGQKVWNGTISENRNVHLPPWICQPWVRIPPEEHIKKMQEAKEKQEKENVETTTKRIFDGQAENVSKKKLKKMQRLPTPKLNPHSRKIYSRCVTCLNPVGLKCEYKLCKICCRKKCSSEIVNCSGHHITRKTTPRLQELTTKAVEVQT